MKLSTILFAFLLPLALAVPAAQEADGDAAAAEGDGPGPGGDGDGSRQAEGADSSAAARSITCTTRGDGVRYRRCPSTDNRRCPAVGQYPKGRRVTFVCITYGTPVHGNRYWVKATNGYYSAAYYFDHCTGGGRLPWC